MHVVREGYHEQLLEVTEACRVDGLVFAEQMGELCRAFRYQRQQMRPDLGGQDFERPSPALARTPAGRIMEMVMGYASENLKPGQTTRAKRMEEQAKAEAPKDRGSFVIESGPLPSLPVALRPVKGPSHEVLMSLPKSEYIRIKAGEVRLETMKRRLREAIKHAKDKGSTIKLVCWKDADGSIIVRHA